jgi:4-hydroxy-4-methyl-2-oxoglutarate aldolase
MLDVGFRVITDVVRPPSELISSFESLFSCDVSDVLHRAGTMSGIRPAYTPIPHVVGPAITVQVPAGGINMVKLGIEQTRAGDVLVVSVQGDCATATWGGNLSRGLYARGVAGLIVDGAVRDVSQIREIGLPVFSRGIATVAGAYDAPSGEVNVPIACGGVVVFPGDIIVADEDGIVVVPPQVAAEVAKGVAELMAHQRGLQEVLLRGEVTNIENIRRQYVAAGLSIVNGEGPKTSDESP